MAIKEINDNIVSSKQRKVRFADNLHETVEFEQNAERDVVWVAPELCNRNKESAYRDGRAFARKGWDSLLHDAFLEPSSDVQADLNTFVLLGDDEHSPRGIERHISAKHADDRRFKRCQTVETVVDLYLYMKRRGESWEAIEKELEEVSLEHSTAAAKFARSMALADQLAVVREDADTTCSSMSDVSSVSTCTSSRRSAKSIMSFSSKTKNRTSRLARMITGQGFTSKR